MITYDWFSTTQQQVIGGVEAQQQSQLRAQGSQLTILSVVPLTCGINIENTGKYNLSDFAVYANGTYVTTTIDHPTIAPGETATLTITSCSLSGTYELKITTPYTEALVSADLAGTG